VAWNFILTDNNGTPLGEILNASDRKVALPLNKLDTLSFRVRLDNPLADWLVTNYCHVKGYRNNVLRYFGPVISAEEAGDASGGSVAVNSVGAGWILAKRLAGKSATGVVINSQDRAQIINSLITTTNTENATGISIDASNGSASSVGYTAGPYRPILDIITELAASYDGFDWRILPHENWVNGAISDSNFGQFYARPSIGIQQPDAVFEWGSNGRGNIASYTRMVSRDSQANKVYHFTTNGPDAPGFPTISAIDADSIRDWRLLEDLAQADLIDTTLRQRLVDEHVKLRKYPRQIITFEPHIDPGNTGRLPNFGTDYDVGDRVRARAQYEKSVRFDGMFRVWGVTFDIDALGVERASLTLADEG
jgi:hypothetical protein